MTIPLVQTYRIARYILEQKLKGNKRYPLVLMLSRCSSATSRAPVAARSTIRTKFYVSAFPSRMRSRPSTSAARRSCRSRAASR